ncbi:hypothetical protein ACFV6G_29735 [Streptomyces lavendulae]
MAVANRSLEALFVETGWTNGDFVRAVERVASELGVPFGYDESAVRH